MEFKASRSAGTSLVANGFDDLDPNTIWTFSAVIADLMEVDSDGDGYDPGAFDGHPPVLVSQWGHGSWTPGLLPVGVARIAEFDGKAVVAGMFLPTTAGRETFRTLRAVHPTVPIEWSYAYDVISSRNEHRGGKAARILEKVLVHEVCPVPRGAGVGTRLLSTSVTQAERAAEIDAQKVLADAVLRLEYQRFQELTGR